MWQEAGEDAMDADAGAGYVPVLQEVKAMSFALGFVAGGVFIGACIVIVAFYWSKP